MAEAAAVVLPYRQLDSSGVLATAIGYGRPVVVSDVGSLGEIVREYGAGEVVPPGDPRRSRKPATACSSRPRSRRPTPARRRPREQLTWKKAAQAHDALYREVRR